jgi:peroxiredoxin
MSGRWRLIVIGVVVVGIFVFFKLYYGTEGERTAPRAGAAKTGEIAPDFELQALGGNPVKLSDHRGKVVFLNIWASWCPPCRDEMPSMKALWKGLKGRQFEILAVSIDQKGEGTVAPFVTQHGLTFPVLLDPDGKTYKLYGLTGVPETFIIDRNGTIVIKVVGPQDWMNPRWLAYFDSITK